MPDKNIEFANIVATPTETSWSQTYNAGRLFAVLSLSKEKKESGEQEHLGNLGKKILNSLEEEYFTLEVKNLESMKGAVSNTLEHLPKDSSSSFIITSIVQNVLYVFGYGFGKALLKRGENLGTILQASEALSSASGFLQDGDIIILETQQFGEIISDQDLSESLDNYPPKEIAETLSPKIHEKEVGGASAVIILFKELPKESAEQEETIGEEIEQERKEFETEKKEVPIRSSFFSYFKKLLKIRPKTIPHSKRVLLSVALVLLLILVGSVYFAVKRQEDAKIQTLFNEVYPPAQKKYDEGIALVSLNQNLAREDLEASQKIIAQAKPKFKKGSKEHQKLLELEKKVEEALSASSGINKVETKLVDFKQSDFLLLVKETKNALAAAQDETSTYYVENTGLFSVDKKNKKTKTLVKNDDDWTEAVGIGVFSKNVYILDRKGKILKFVGGNEKANYFAQNANPDLSNSVGLAIDGAIYVLFKDGSVQKFLRGKPENFTISGLDSPFSNPTQIFTNADSNNLYILDNGNSRVVVFDKKGVYQSQYSADVIRDAKHFEVLEDKKKLYVLSKDKLFEIDLK